MGRHTRFIGYGYDPEKGQRKCDKLLEKLREQSKKPSIEQKTREEMQKDNSIEQTIRQYDIEVIGNIKESTIRAYLPELTGKEQ